MSEQDHLDELPEEIEQPEVEEEITPEKEQALVDELFAQNGLSSAMIATFKKQYGEIGWVSFNMNSSPVPVVFVFRAIRRDEWRNEVKPFMMREDVTQDDADEYVASYGTIYPIEARDVRYWGDKGGLIPTTLSGYIMEVSGAQPVTTPLKL